MLHAQRAGKPFAFAPVRRKLRGPKRSAAAPSFRAGVGHLAVLVACCFLIPAEPTAWSRQLDRFSEKIMLEARLGLMAKRDYVSGFLSLCTANTDVTTAKPPASRAVDRRVRRRA